MATTFNPADLTATTLSNGNLTATPTAAGGVRSIFSASTGKWYWEVLFVSGASPGIGVANASATLGTVWNTPINAAIAYNSASYVNNVVQSGGIVINVGTTVCIALDFVAQRIWFRAGAAGQWNGSGTDNPATATGGYNIAVLGTPLFAFVATNSTAQHTANFGATGFVGAAPSGFTAGFGLTTAQLTQIAAEQWGVGTPAVQLTQVAIEHWAAVATNNPQLVATQIALEQWAAVLPTGGAAAAQSRVMVMA